MKINWRFNIIFILFIAFCFMGILVNSLNLKFSSKYNKEIKVVNMDYQNEDIAKSYIISKGYKIVAFEGVIDKNLKLPIKMETNFKTYKYIITNHPLEKIQNGSSTKIEAFVVIDNGVVVLAYSSPVVNNPKVLKQFYTIDGKPLIEDPKIVYPNDDKKNQ